MAKSVWQRCLASLENELSNKQLETCIRPLQVRSADSKVQLFAPNKYIMELVSDQFMKRITELVNLDGDYAVSIDVGSSRKPVDIDDTFEDQGFYPLLDLNKDQTFNTFVEGRSNQIARAAALQVSENVGRTPYNPLLLYGGVGLGKTHLMHAVGNAILARHPHLKVSYMYSQRFMEDMVRAIEHGTMSDFTQYYRSVDVLLMDDIQFLTKGVKTQEEFFHVFNRLQENGRQIVLTCDRYPKEIEGLEERLESRFVWGLSAQLEPPDLETRVAILMKKADLEKVDLPQDAALFIAECIRSNVRELEGALKRVTMDAGYKGQKITLEQVRESLRDLVAVHDRKVSIENIQKTVAEYYRISIKDLLSKKRSVSIARPRQIAMTLAKELTNRSLPEVGDAFNGKDHTTVLHANRRIVELRATNQTIEEDYNNLLRILTS